MHRCIIKLNNEVDLAFYCVRVLGGRAGLLGLVNCVSLSLSYWDMRRLRKQRQVLYIEPDRRVYALLKPSTFSPASMEALSESYDKARQWAVGPNKEAWKPHLRGADYSRGRDAVVGIVDTGVDYNHPDLGDAVINGYNAITGTLGLISANDDNGHGTFCAGIAGARANEFGCVGIAPECKLVAIKVLDRYGRGYVSSIIKGIQWAMEQNIDLVSMSLGAASGSEALKEAVESAAQKGLGMVAASGNNGWNNRVSYPAAYPEVICVAALGQNKQRAGFSNASEAVDIAACGEYVYSLDKDGGYQHGTGTSAATPVVAGVLAMTCDLKNESRKWLYQGADNVGAPGWDKYTGWGSVNGRKTIDEIFSSLK